MSKEQRRYLKKLKVKKAIILFSQLLLTVLFLLTWEYLSNKNIINPFIFSSPSKIISTIKSLYINYSLISHIIVTLEEILIAFVLGIALSFILGIIFYEIPIIYEILDPFLTMLNSLPKVALGPLIIIVVGANTKSIIVMALLINLIVSLITIYTGFINTNKTKINLLKSFNATKKQILYNLVIPASFKNIVSSLKINLSMTFIGVIMGEFLVSKQGIGYLIIYGTQVFNLNIVMSGIIILIVLSYLLYLLINIIEKNLIKLIN